MALRRLGLSLAVEVGKALLSGRHVFCKVADLGLVVLWDQVNRVQVRLRPQWAGRVRGLCGNYNKDRTDDLKTPSGMLLPNPAQFGDSWRLRSYCPRAQAVKVVSE